MLKDLTRTLQMPEGVTLLKGTRIKLTWDVCIRKKGIINKATTGIELFFTLQRPGQEDLQLETDSVLGWDDLPNPARNARSWEKVRQINLDHLEPTWSYGDIALESAVRKWHFILAFDEASTEETAFCFIIVRDRNRDHNIEACANMKRLKPFLSYNSPTHKHREAIRQLVRS